MKVFDILDGFKEVTHNYELGKSHYWIMLKATEIECMKGKIVIDEESLNECKDYCQSSKISFFSGYIFLVFNILYYSNSSVQSKELNIFLSKDYIITVYKDEIDMLSNLIDDIKGGKDCFIIKDKPHPCTVFYYIIDRIILKNYNVISALEAQADRIEISVLKSPQNEQVEELINLRRQVYKIRKYLNPLRYIGDSLVSNENDIIEKKYISYFISLNNKIDKLMLSLESLVQDLALVREAFEAETANKTNELMKIFTLIATIFLPLNLITSMYGMNFKEIPLVCCDHGYYYIILVMILIALGLVLMFKKKKWL